MMRGSCTLIAAVLFTAATARAQPAPDVPPQPQGPEPGTPSNGPAQPEPRPQPAPVPHAEPDFGDPYAPKPVPPKKPEAPLPPIFMPEVLTTPTGWLLPAAVLYSKTSLDTGGGVTSDTRVGLGDVVDADESTGRCMLGVCQDAHRDRTPTWSGLPGKSDVHLEVGVTAVGQHAVDRSMQRRSVRVDDGRHLCGEGAADAHP